MLSAQTKHHAKTFARLTTHHLSRGVTQVSSLRSWQLEPFQKLAFEPQRPAILPRTAGHIPPACTRWFEIVNNASADSSDVDTRLRLKRDYFVPFESTFVPLEITRTLSQDATDVKFEKIGAPLKVLLNSLGSVGGQAISIYLAQHDIRDLPTQLRDDLPTPSLVRSAGKGDVYSSSLWMGKAPTYTPLHRDPNPNLFMQIAETKSIRLFRPELGDAIFDLANKLLERQGQTSLRHSAALRGNEMMQGPERRLLHDLVWPDAELSMAQQAVLISQHAHDATLQAGEALFIPKGWWHSVKGTGNINASANWWFR